MTTTGTFTGDGVSSTVADRSGTECTSSTPKPPRCSFAQILEACHRREGADALATIELGTGPVGGPPLSWTFEIVDRATGTKVFKKTLGDDC